MYVVAIASPKSGEIGVAPPCPATTFVLRNSTSPARSTVSPFGTAPAPSEKALSIEALVTHVGSAKRFPKSYPRAAADAPKSMLDHASPALGSSTSRACGATQFLDI